MEEHTAVVAVHRSRKRAECLEFTLILESVGIEYQLHREVGEYAIVVKSSDAARARAELQAYVQENRGWQVRAPTMPGHAGGWIGVLVYWDVLVLVALLRHYHAWGADWLTAGRMNAGLVCRGEWWRTVTALGLHLDLTHLLGNLLFGTLFGLFAGQLLGSGLAWFSILVAGALGNAMNAWLQPAHHSAVGASTAIFAALGILSAHAWKHRQYTERGWVRRLVPLLGGVALLAFVGTGGARTDFVAHLTGFFSGLLLGAAYGSLGPHQRLAGRVQLGFGAAAIGLLAFAWFCALRADAQ